MEALQVKQTTERLLVGAAEAAAMLGVSRATFLRLDRTGRLGPRSVRLGRLVRWHRQQIEQWAAQGCPPRATWRKGGAA
jgi:excisionase family DNA binding protein